MPPMSIVSVVDIGCKDWSGRIIFSLDCVYMYPLPSVELG